ALTDLDAVGGRSMRLGGTDKPGLIVGEQTLLGSVVSAVTSAGADRIVVVGPERPAALSPGTGGPSPGDLGTGARGRVRYAREDPPGRGPVAALACGLDQVSAPVVVLLAADLPFLRPAHVTRLLTALAAQDVPGVVLLDDSARPQWLVSGWPTAGLRAALSRYPGSSLGGLLGPLDPVLLPDETAAGEPPAWLDCDTAGDLRRAREWATLARGEQEATR
ncbi:MAG: molybdenum cofactor guanylyltransferase, partial [Streptosporangiaceae bacterium]